MSTKAHFIYETGIEGFEETSEPSTIFGKVKGFNAYLCLEWSVLKSFSMVGEYLIIETKNTDKLPKKFSVWGGAILEFECDEDGLAIHLDGGNHITKQIVSNDYSKLTQ